MVTYWRTLLQLTVAAAGAAGAAAAVDDDVGDVSDVDLDDDEGCVAEEEAEVAAGGACD